MSQVRKRFATALLAVVVAIGSVGFVVVSAQSQSISRNVNVAVTAKRLEDGRTQFAIFQSGARIYLQSAYFPAEADVGKWLVSKEAQYGLYEPEAALRIAARLVDDGRLEFGIQVRDDTIVGGDSEWSEVLLPRARYMPADARVGAWLTSSQVDPHDAKSYYINNIPRVELLSTTVKDCGYNDCMVFLLRNNHNLKVTDVMVKIYPRDRWGDQVNRCGHYGQSWTWWRLNGQPNGNTFTVQNDEACLRGLGPKSSGELVLVMFSDGSTWRP